ncbi:MAG: tRNA lysidine(34) synthetase TilS [Candidatus Omnitrophica bacterium]|nr:tRNA lysidine(34) synthetase TilS [Candidatus Omnitrophota bacterium]
MVADRVVVGISGGCDSVFLLYCLKRNREKWHLTLTAAHYNHCMRGQESDEDERFVAAFCKKLNIPLVVGRWDRPGNGKISEEKARDARYQFFEKVCRSVAAKKIALAHTFDDDAETILFRLLRGSGLSGLRGIPYERELGSCRIIRPLKDVSREEIQAYLQKEKIPWREDSSNLDRSYRRNRIRHELLPLLAKEYNPHIKEILVHLGRNLSEDYEYLRKEAGCAFEEALLTSKKDQVVLRRKTFSKFPVAIQKELFRKTLRELGAGMDKVGYSDWKSVAGLLDRKHFRTSLPDALDLMATPTKLIFSKSLVLRKKI